MKSLKLQDRITRVALLQGFADEEDREVEMTRRKRRRIPFTWFPQRSGKSIPPNLKGFLEEQTKEQLIALLKDLSERYPSVREDLQDRQNLSKGSVKRLVSCGKERNP